MTSKYKLVIASIREEFLDRNTLPAKVYAADGEPKIYGKDNVSGGSWLAVSRNKFAFVTNFKEPPVFLKSRGELVLNYLNGLDNEPINEYNGFNLVCGDYNGNARYITNRNEQESMQLQVDTTYAVTNNTLFDSKWERQIQGIPLFDIELDKDLPEMVAGLFNMLRKIAIEKKLVDGRWYGPRSYTVVVVDELARFWEQTEGTAPIYLEIAL